MTIKEKITEYRNLHKESRTLLGVVLAEFVLVEKAPKREPGDITDAEAIPIIKKMIENNKLCGTTDENIILEKFIPQQLSISDIENIIKHNDFHSVGDCMKYFKLSHTGLYDGKTVSKIFNNK